MVLVVDHQIGLMHLVRDIQPDVFRQNVLGPSALANVFNLPVVLTTSAETGMGSLPPPPPPVKAPLITAITLFAVLQTNF